MLDVEILDEFPKKYNNTIVKYNDTPYYITSITGMHITGMLLANDCSWAPKKIKCNDEAFSDDWPKLKNIYLSEFKATSYISRYPYRKWKVGLCDELISWSITQPEEFRYMKLTPHLSTGNGSIIKDLYFPKFFSVEEALLMLNTRKILSAPVNEDISIGWNLYHKFPVIYFGHLKIGFVPTRGDFVLFDYAYFLHNRISTTMDVRIEYKNTSAAIRYKMHASALNALYME